MIQEQMHELTETHSVGEERYARAKQENATLQARILMLEEAAKDAESRAEEKLEVCMKIYCREVHGREYLMKIFVIFPKTPTLFKK